MQWRENSYRIHRWLALVVGLQLLAWSLSGFIFSILDLDGVTLSPSEALDLVGKKFATPVAPSTITLRKHNGRIGYEIIAAKEVPIAWVDASTGAVRLRISETEASSIALADFTGQATIASVEFLEGEPPLEFRGGRMPVYRVTLEHSKQVNIYICPVLGHVLKRRNKVWRIFDFFWMLHILDYNGREDFNHWLLQGMSLLAILTSASGITLWWWSRPKWMRRKKLYRDD